MDKSLNVVSLKETPIIPHFGAKRAQIEFNSGQDIIVRLSCIMVVSFGRVWIVIFSNIKAGRFNVPLIISRKFIVIFDSH